MTLNSNLAWEAYSRCYALRLRLVLERQAATSGVSSTLAICREIIAKEALEDVKTMLGVWNPEVKKAHGRGNPDWRKPGEPNPIIRCACGCGQGFTRYDDRGRPRRF